MVLPKTIPPVREPQRDASSPKGTPVFSTLISYKGVNHFIKGDQAYDDRWIRLNKVGYERLGKVRLSDVRLGRGSFGKVGLGKVRVG